MKIVLFATVIGLTSTPFCGLPSNPQPPPGTHELGIPFQQWIHSGACSAANVSMWVRHRGTPYPSSQQDIIDYMAWEYWWEVGPDGSMSVWAIQQALWEWSNINARDEFYAGPDEKRRAVADIKRGINDGNPSIVITNFGLHSRLVKGGRWTQLPNYQPSVEFITTHDPADFGPRSDTVGFWIDFVGAGEPRANSPYIRSVQWYWQRGSGGAALAEFDYWGGTYYGEEDPPEGCPECPPIMARKESPRLFHALKNWFTRPAVRMTNRNLAAASAPFEKATQDRRPGQRRKVGPEYQAQHPVRRYNFVPKPYATDRAGVVENMWAAFTQTHLSEVEGWEDLQTLIAENRIGVSSVHPVQSLTGLPNYWLITIQADGRPIAQALVNDVGWLLSVMRAGSGRTVNEPKTPEWARLVAAEMGYARPNVRLVHMSNNVTPMSGSSDYVPFFEISSVGQPSTYVAQDGTAYRVDPAGTGRAFWRDGERRLVRVR